MTDGTADPAELAKFEAMAADWWDPRGKFRPLHLMNPCRLDYILGQISAEHGRDTGRRGALAGLTVLDIGCGGGLLAEPMARLGAGVTAIDPAPGNIEVARVHARQSGLAIDYRATTAEALGDTGTRFDVVLAMEVVEHVPDPVAFVAAAARLLAPGGLLVVSTINRTRKAWALAVVGAERVLGWLPAGTHDWHRFVTPAELTDAVGMAGLKPVDQTGFVFDPLGWRWRLAPRDLSVNFAVAAVAPS